MAAGRPGDGVKEQVKTIIRWRALPASVRDFLRARYNFARALVLGTVGLPFIRRLRCLQLRRLRPLQNGKQRGTPIVRYYWSCFLEQHRMDLRGYGLEVGTTSTIRHYAGQALKRADAIDLEAHSPEVTVVADLSRADHVPSNTYDCFINQFTMHLIYDAK